MKSGIIRSSTSLGRFVPLLLAGCSFAKDEIALHDSEVSRVNSVGSGVTTKAGGAGGHAGRPSGGSYGGATFQHSSTAVTNQPRNKNEGGTGGTSDLYDVTTNGSALPTTESSVIPLDSGVGSVGSGGTLLGSGGTGGVKNSNITSAMEGGSNTSIVVCPEGQILCDGTCTDPRYDVNHCGRCDTTCKQGTFCSLGNCLPQCVGLAYCGGNCADTRTDTQHCGVCGHECKTGESCLNGICQAKEVIEPRCNSVGEVALSNPQGYPSSTRPQCTLVGSRGRMTYTLVGTGDGPYAACDFGTYNLESFDADNTTVSSLIEIEFCTSNRISGELNLWFGTYPSRKKLELLGRSELMDPGCKIVRHAPEEAVCHWTANPAWAGDCSAVTVGDTSCAACGARCNQNCTQLNFSSAKLSLTVEQTTLAQPNPVTIDLVAIRLLPNDCTCTSDAQCSLAKERTVCKSGLFSSRVCPMGVTLCGVCVPPEANCPLENSACTVQVNSRNCIGKVACRGTVSTCLVEDSGCLIR